MSHLIIKGVSLTEFNNLKSMMYSNTTRELLDDILLYIKEGYLVKWLDDIGESDLADQVRMMGMSDFDSELLRKFYNLCGVNSKIGFKRPSAETILVARPSFIITSNKITVKVPFAVKHCVNEEYVFSWEAPELGFGRTNFVINPMTIERNRNSRNHYYHTYHHYNRSADKTEIMVYDGKNVLYHDNVLVNGQEQHLSTQKELDTFSSLYDILVVYPDVTLGGGGCARVRNSLFESNKTHAYSNWINNAVDYLKGMRISFDWIDGVVDAFEDYETQKVLWRIGFILVCIGLNVFWMLNVDLYHIFGTALGAICQLYLVGIPLVLCAVSMSGEKYYTTITELEWWKTDILKTILISIGGGLVLFGLLCAPSFITEYPYEWLCRYESIIVIPIKVLLVFLSVWPLIIMPIGKRRNKDEYGFWWFCTAIFEAILLVIIFIVGIVKCFI